MKNFLLLTYYFPPAPMGYSQRVAKLCKYLPSETNWWPNVICGELPVDILQGVDNVLAREIPNEVMVKRIPSFLSSNFASKLRRSKLNKLAAIFRKLAVLPDTYGDWIGHAVNEAERIFPGGKDIDCIFASGPPNSVYLAGLRTALNWKIPLIIDMRDPWSRSSLSRQFIIPWHKKNIERMQREVYKTANAIIANTDGNALDLIQVYPELVDKVFVVPNGYDPDDISFCEGPRLRRGKESDGTVHLLYLGGIRGKIQGKQLFEGPFLQAVADYLVDHPRDRPLMKLHFVGGIDSQVKVLAQSFGLEDICHAYGVIPTNQVGRPLKEADIYVLLLPPNKGVDKGWIPAKTYYYLAGGKYILAIVPEGSTREMLNSLGGVVKIADPSNHQEIKSTLERIIKLIRSLPRTEFNIAVPSYAKKYDRRIIAQMVGNILDYVCSRVY